MAGAGKPKTGGRQKGVGNQKTRLLAEEAKRAGVPLSDIIAASARALYQASLDSRTGKIVDLDMAERAGELAVKGAKFFHPTYAQVQVSGGMTISHEMAILALK